jgi:long-chain acyl-CoA synthetase
MGLEIVQGYGLTRMCPILALNRDVDYKDNAAGLPLQVSRSRLSSQTKRNR